METLSQRKIPVEFSLIVPLCNEEESVAALHEEIVSVLGDREYELIYVNDGSTDATYAQIKKAVAFSDSAVRVKIISLSRNSGQSFAFKVGLDNSRFPLIVFMDGDLQSDPRDIMRLIDKIEEGYDLVQGIRVNRKDAFFNKILPSVAANFLLRTVCGSKFRDIGCSLKVFRKSFVVDMLFQQGMHRILPVYFDLKGARVCELKVNHRKREHGKTKYGFSRTFEVVFEIIKINFFEKNSNSFLFSTGIFSFLIFSYGLIKSILLFFYRKPYADVYFLLSLLGFYLFVISAALYISRSFYVYYKDNARLNDVAIEVFP